MTTDPGEMLQTAVMKGRRVRRLIITDNTLVAMLGAGLHLYRVRADAFPPDGRIAGGFHDHTDRFTLFIESETFEVVGATGEIPELRPTFMVW